MVDKTVLITGGSSGLGYECAKSILASGQGWQVVITGRDEQKARTAAECLNAAARGSQVAALTLDLASLQSVRDFAGAFPSRAFPPLRALVCNAGVQIVSDATFTEDGFETTFGVNHLGHFLLVNLLLKHLAAPARIVIVSSDTHDPARKTGMPAPQYENALSLAFPQKNSASPNTREDPTTGRRRYTTSKLCNIYFTYELSRRLVEQRLSTDQKPITANAFNPGLMPGTGLARDYSQFQRFAWNYILPVLRPLARFFFEINSAQESGGALARLVLDPFLESVSGKYYSGRKEVPSSRASYDTQNARELWETSARLVRLTSQETFIH